MALPEAPPEKQHPQMGVPKGGVLVTTPMGPKPQIVEDDPPSLSDSTMAEQQAGKEASKKAQDRQQKEQEAGQALTQRLGGGQPKPKPKTE